MVEWGGDGFFQTNDLTAADDRFQKEMVVGSDDDELFVGFTLLESF